jgi:hypothetical protein
MGNDSDGLHFGKNKRILSPELVNSRARVGGNTNNPQGNFNLTNKNSYSHASHGEAQRRSDNGYHVPVTSNSIGQTSGGTS